LAKTVFFGVLKLDSVTLPSFSMLELYLLGSGLSLGMIKLSTECFFPSEFLGLLLNLERQLMDG
jgi:hypothetical protein